MKKFLIFLFLLSIPFLCLAETGNTEVFEAKVLDIIQEKTITTESGTEIVQQDVKLRGLNDEWQGRDFEVKGINDLEVVTSVQVEKGDKVLVSKSTNFEGNEQFMITDHVRRGSLYWLAAVFALLLIIVGGKQGWKAIISLLITFFVIMKLIIPNIVSGFSPLIISLFGSVIILGIIVYITWGFKKKAHIAIFSILISLGITGLISILFTKLTKLSGLADDEILFLVGNSGITINFEGLLLAGIIIGTLGVLDDVVISQISTIEQLKNANSDFKQVELYKRGMNVGVDHISSMTNTLFLAYAGASIPLLLLFTFQQEPFVGFSQIINNELIATEIVRTLVGSIGIILAVPIATFIASVYYSKNN